MTPRANTEYNDLVDWLSGLSQDHAQRFTTVFHAEMMSLCQEVAEQIAASGRPARLPNEEASLTFSRPAYRTTFTTQKKRVRRSASGTYHADYTLRDNDGDGRADTLIVMSVRYAGARPLWDVDRDE